MFLLKSKTIIINALLILGGLYLPDISEDMRNILVTTGLLNIGLRMKTNESVFNKGKKNGDS